MSAPKVYAAMVGVMEDIGKEGISKARKNEQQGYKFRGIDDVYNELNRLLAKHHLLMLPTVVKDEQTERQTPRGGTLFFTRLTVDFKLVCADDGSSEIVRTIGEAMDSGDKSTNKAQSAAYKYAAMQVFCIPTEGDNDADAKTHEVAPEAKPEPAKAAREVATAEEMAISHLRSCAIDREMFKEAWEKNRAGWRGVMDAEAYARVVAEMKRLATTLCDEPKPQPADDLNLAGDAIPAEFV